MPMEQFDIDDQPTDHLGIPLGRFMPLTPSRSYLGGGLLLGQFVLGGTSSRLGPTTSNSTARHATSDTPTPNRPSS
ncbi:hypothetical protein [Nocardia sp. CA-119907]|uniref:hypothetical protein n=1 Tax=Nocardia sp. CA-119907 TaxID=3239973 RepID=UPI003D977C6B